MVLSSPENNKDFYFEIFLGLYDRDVFQDLIGAQDLEEVFFSSFRDFIQELSKNYPKKDLRNDDFRLDLEEKVALLRALFSKCFIQKNDNITHTLSNQAIVKDGNNIQRAAYISYTYITELIGYLEKALEGREPPIMNINKTNHKKTKGFQVRNTDCLKDVYHQLMHFNYLSDMTDYMSFEESFTGSIPKHKLLWIGDKGHLNLFISEIFKRDYVMNGERGKWDIAIKTFYYKDENPIKKDNLKTNRPKTIPEGIKLILQSFKVTNIP